MKEIKWHVFFDYPYPRELGNGFDLLTKAINAVTMEGIPKWNVLIESRCFGLGGCHRVVWNGNRGAWVNKRTGSTIEQEGWI